jgi:glycine dehydrogenase
MAKKLAPYFPIVYKGREGLVAHECIIDVRPLKKSHEIDVTDIAKRLMDFGFHAPTMSWPVIGTLMIEPTESESKKELDRYCDAMIQIRKEADECPDVIRNAPHTAIALMSSDWKASYSRDKAAYPLSWVRGNKYWPPVGRVDNAYGDKNIVCSCPPMDDYK